MAKNIKGITIQIGAETKGLDKALKDVNAKSRDINKELRDVNKLLKFNPKDTELLSQKQKLLGDQIAATKEKLDRLKAAQDEVKRQYQAGEIDEGQYRAFQREIIETESKLKHYQEQLKEVNKESNVFAQKMGEVSKKLKEVGSKVQDVGKQMSLKVTAPIAAVGTASIAAFKEVDEALDTIVTKTGATGDAMKGFEKSFRNIGKKLPVELQVVGDAIGEVNTQFGFTGEKLEKASEQMIKFAQINGQDVTASTIAAKRAIEAFELTADDLDMVLDSVTKTAQNTGVGTDKIFDSIVRGAPQLKDLNLDFAQAAEVMGRLEQKGIDSSKALGYMSRAQVTLAKEGKTLEEGLAELTEKIQNSESETDKLALASEYFGTKGATFMLDAINRGALDFGDFAGAAENAAGTVSETFEETLDPIDKFKVVMNNAKLVGSDIATTLQDVLAPILEKLVEKLQKVTDWFKNLSPEMQETIIKVALAAAAIGPLLIVIGKVISVVGTIMKVLPTLKVAIAALTGPIGLVVAAIAAAIAIGVLLWKNWDKIKEFAGKLWEGIKDIFAKIGKWISDTWNKAKEWTSNTWNNIKNTVSETAGRVRDGISSAFGSARDSIVGAWERVKENTSNAWNTIRSKVEEHGGGIRGVISTALEGYKNSWRQGWEAMNRLSGGKLGEMVSSIKSKMSDIRDRIANSKIGQAWSKIWDLKLPKIKLPKFSITGKFSLSPLQVPKISVVWNAKGALLDGATLFGAVGNTLLGGGEAGKEAVIPLEGRHMYPLADAIAERLGGAGVNLNIYPQHLTPDELDRTFHYLNRRFGVNL